MTTGFAALLLLSGSFQPAIEEKASLRFVAMKPVWVAFQDGDGAWKRVASGADEATATITDPKGRYSWAVVTSMELAEETKYEAHVLHCTAAEAKELTIGPQMFAIARSGFITGAEVEPTRLTIRNRKPDEIIKYVPSGTAPTAYTDGWISQKISDKGFIAYTMRDGLGSRMSILRGAPPEKEITLDLEGPNSFALEQVKLHTPESMDIAFIMGVDGKRGTGYRAERKKVGDGAYIYSVPPASAIAKGDFLEYVAREDKFDGTHRMVAGNVAKLTPETKYSLPNWYGPTTVESNAGKFSVALPHAPGARGYRITTFDPSTRVYMSQGYHGPETVKYSWPDFANVEGWSANHPRPSKKFAITAQWSSQPFAEIVKSSALHALGQDAGRKFEYQVAGWSGEAK